MSKNDVSASGIFATDLIKGQTAILELFEPAQRAGETSVELSRVVHGDKNMFTPMNYGDADQGCTIDVRCAGNLYENASGGAAMVLLADGTRICSGSLLNNGCADFTPNFLTAFHCLDVGDLNPPSSCDPEWGNGGLSANEINRAQNFVFRFQYKSQTCDGPEPLASQWFTFNGATFRSGWFNTDFVLLEMNERPRGDRNTGIRYLGWSRDQLPPRTSYHHPMGDVMKWSLTDGAQNWNAAPIIVDIGCNRFSTIPAQTHWEVEFQQGRVQHGSSGGPILDQPTLLEPRYVIGQLHAGEGSCPPQMAWYGRFDLSWAGGGTAQTSLAPWLTNDPNVMNTWILAAPYIQQSSGGPVVCSTAVTFDLIDAPPASTHNVIWTTTPNLSILSQTHSSVSVQYSGVQSGVGTITANISSTNSALCTVSAPFSLDVQAGPFNEDQVTVSGQSRVCSSSCYDYTAIVPGGHKAGYTYTWIYPTGWFTCGRNENWICLCPPNGWSGSGTVRVSVNNGCGTNPPRGIPVFSDPSCGSAPLAYYPNPAEDEFTVSFNGDSETGSSYGIKIYDTQANLIYSTTSNQKTITIPTSTVPEGRYILNIIHKDGIIRRQIFISR